MKFCDLLPQYVGGFMFDRIIGAALGVPEKFGLLSEAQGLEKVAATIINSLKTFSKILPLICSPITSAAANSPEAKYIDVFKRLRQHFNCFVVNISNMIP